MQSSNRRSHSDNDEGYRGYIGYIGLYRGIYG